VNEDNLKNNIRKNLFRDPYFWPKYHKHRANVSASMLNRFSFVSFNKTCWSSIQRYWNYEEKKGRKSLQNTGVYPDLSR